MRWSYVSHILHTHPIEHFLIHISFTTAILKFANNCFRLNLYVVQITPPINCTFYYAIQKDHSGHQNHPFYQSFHNNVDPFYPISLWWKYISHPPALWMLRNIFPTLFRWNLLLMTHLSWFSPIYLFPDIPHPICQWRFLQSFRPNGHPSIYRAMRIKNGVIVYARRKT